MAELFLVTATEFISATIMDVVTRAIFSAIEGNLLPFNAFDSVILGLESGVAAIAPSLASEVLKSSAITRKFTQNRWTGYVAHALVSSAIVTGVNYPLSKAAELHRKGSTRLSLREFANHYADRIVAGIAYPAIMDALGAALPATKHPIAAYGRDGLITLIASAGAAIAAVPIAKVENRGIIAAVAVGALLPGILVSEEVFTPSIAGKS
jgi:hypothetical protein